MTTVLAVVVLAVMVLALAATVIGMAKGCPFAWVNWWFNAGEWVRIVGLCLAVLSGKSD